MMLKGLTAQYLCATPIASKRATRSWSMPQPGVWVILCQWGKALGATVIGCVGTPEGGAREKSGAKHTILYREEDFAKRVI